MTKPLKNQWNFGELFPVEQIRRVYSVTELTGSIRRLLEKEFQQVWVGGEITNLRIQSSGHAYFAIKDNAAQLGCVLFKSEAAGIDRKLLRDGQKVVVAGEISVYEARGQYQLRVLNLELQGQGALQAAFEKLKEKLNAEGLFAPERKRPIPRFPKRIGLVTSRTGAALQDVLHVVQRRHCGLEILLAQCRVQGQGAAEEIACAIALLNDWSSGRLRTKTGVADQPLDLILLTRGGGSLEDLWAFNEEVVARAIFSSILPVISAVGHEIDFTISDFVADLRAATPSAAAELITEGYFSSREPLGEMQSRLTQLVRRRVAWDAEELAALQQRVQRAHPRRMLRARTQFLDELLSRLSRGVRARVLQFGRTVGEMHARVQRSRPAARIVLQRQKVQNLELQLPVRARAWLHSRRSHLHALMRQLETLSPQQTLARGFSVTLDPKTGQALKDARQLAPGDRLLTRLARGEVESIVQRTEP